jgi:Rap1a immunity proteins
MKSGLTMVAAGLFGVLVQTGVQAAPVSRDDFQVETTGNLVALCGAAQTDPLYTAAVNFCHGFGVATYRAITMQQMAMRTKRKLFCLPTNTPTRDQAISAFVQWASTRPATLASTPTNGIAEYLAAEYPCPTR